MWQNKCTILWWIYSITFFFSHSVNTSLIFDEKKGKICIMDSQRKFWRAYWLRGVGMRLAVTKRRRHRGTESIETGWCSWEGLFLGNRRGRHCREFWDAGEEIFNMIVWTKTLSNVWEMISYLGQASVGTTSLEGWLSWVKALLALYSSKLFLTPN